MNEFVPVATAYRRIVSTIPHPDSVPVITALEQLEPHSMSGFAPVVFQRAAGFQVYDGYGNMWLDFTSSVMLTNAGHSNPRVGQAIRDQLDADMWHNYCHPSDVRLRAVQVLKDITPPYLDKVYLLTTGSEACECAIKLMRIHGRTVAAEKYHILSFHNSFHGRTMGAQQAGGNPAAREWMGAPPPGFHHVPFPECARCPWGRTAYAHCGRDCFERCLDRFRESGVAEELVAGVMIETFQGPLVDFMPNDYALALREWADAHQILLTFDEMQAGFGRTGKWFGFEHYGVEADLICLGKGITSSLPLAAVAGRAAILDIPGHGAMSSTHTGNPLCCAALLGNVAALREGRMIENAAALEPVLFGRLAEMRARFPEHISAVNGKGLVAGIYLQDPDTGELDVELGSKVTRMCIERGLLMLDTKRGTLKLVPPLMIEEAALLEGLDVIEEALAECLRQ